MPGQETASHDDVTTLISYSRSPRLGPSLPTVAFAILRDGLYFCTLPFEHGRFSKH